MKQKMAMKRGWHFIDEGSSDGGFVEALDALD